MSELVFPTRCPKCRQPTGATDYYLNKGRPRPMCKVCWKEQNAEAYRENRVERIVKAGERKRENRERYNGYNRTSRRRLRSEVMAAYGGEHPACKCCGEDIDQFLAIDHLDGGGNAHRRSIYGTATAGDRFYRWLRDNGFPPGFQILCHNCNFAKSAYGVCPHHASSHTP